MAQILVHGEGCARPVAGTSQATELLKDDVAVLLLPLPDLGQERLAAQVLTGLVLFGEELLLHDRLGRDARVIRSRNPDRVKARLATMADDDVLQGAVQGVAHVQNTGHVGRRDDDREGLAATLALGGRLEGATGFPGRVDGALEVSWLVSLGEVHGAQSLGHKSL